VSGAERASRGDRITPGPSTAGLSTEEALELIGSGDMELLGLMPGASNYTFLAKTPAGDAEGVLVVYKPRAGEAPLWDFPDGTLCHREVAAFVLAEALGWPPIPPTTLRDGPHGPGSVQLFIQADVDEHFFTLRRAHADRFRAVAAFDVIANNADRKGGHCLLAENGTIWVIDHGVCFSPAPKLRSVIWDYAGQRLPEPLAADVARVAGELRSGPLRERLLTLLTEQEVDATAARASRLAQTATFPKPVGDRPYPWPPV
jgi:uncharacterized repeat protein (TIGR03843 family)